MENNDNWTMATQDTGIKLPKEESQSWTSPPQENHHEKDDKLSISHSLYDVLCLLKILLVENLMQIAIYPFNIRTKTS